MDLVSNFKDINYKTQKTVACIESYTEYIESKIRDIGNFVTDDSEVESYISIAMNNVIGAKDRIVGLAKSEYQKAMNGDETITVIKPDGTTAEVNAEDVINAINTQITGAQVESQFLQYCKNTRDSLSSSDFVTRIQSLVNNVAPTILDSYTKILDAAGDKLDALAAFFKTHDNSEVTYSASNNYITIVDGAAYEGSMWLAAGTQLWNSISGFFEGVWSGIRSIKDFLTKIVDGLAKLGKWFISKMFHNLSTVYEKVGDDPAQAMDLPIIQLDLGEITGERFYNKTLPTVSSWRQAYEYYDESAGGINTYHRYNLCSNVKINMINQTDYQINQQLIPALLEKVMNLQISNDGTMSNTSTNWCYQVSDMIVPSTPFNLLLRTGVTEDTNHMYICMYVCFTKGTLNLADDDITLMIEHSIDDALRHVLMPTTFFARRAPVDASSTGPSYYANYLRDYIIGNSGLSPDASLYELVSNKMFSKSLSDIPPQETEAVEAGSLLITESDVAMMLMQYVAFVGAGNVKYSYDFTGLTGRVRVSKTEAIPYSNSSYMNAAYEVYDASTTRYIFKPEIDSLGDMTEMDLEFIPYNVCNPIPFSIHYQTTEEQGEEIVHLFWALVAVIAITVITIKVAQWSKNRVNTGQLLLANRDRLSWEFCANPTAENRSLFLKAQKKYRRYNMVNKLLGLSSSADDIYNLVMPANDDTQAQLISLISGL